MGAILPQIMETKDMLDTTREPSACPRSLPAGMRNESSRARTLRMRRRRHSQIEMHIARIDALSDEDFALAAAAEDLHPKDGMLYFIEKRQQEIAAEIDAIFSASSFLQPRTLDEGMLMLRVVRWNVEMLATDNTADTEAKEKRRETIDRLLDDVHQVFPKTPFFDHESFGIEMHPETAAILRMIQRDKQRQDAEPAAVEIAA